MFDVVNVIQEIDAKMPEIEGKPAHNAYHGETHVTNLRYMKRLREARGLLCAARDLLAMLPADLPDPPVTEKAEKPAAKVAKKDKV